VNLHIFLVPWIDPCKTRFFPKKRNYSLTCWFHWSWWVSSLLRSHQGTIIYVFPSDIFLCSYLSALHLASLSVFLLCPLNFFCNAKSLDYFTNSGRNIWENIWQGFPYTRSNSLSTFPELEEKKKRMGHKTRYINPNPSQPWCLIGFFLHAHSHVYSYSGYTWYTHVDFLSLYFTFEL
jgi:hypothetical protein